MNLSNLIIPPNEDVAGKPQAVLGNEWWQKILSIRADENPICDEKGDLESLSQSDTIFFLTGFGSERAGIVERKITIPAERFIFFPLVNVIVDNTRKDKIDPFPGGLTLEKLKQQARCKMDLVFDIKASIDGESVPNLLVPNPDDPNNLIPNSDFRQESLEPFSYKLPENNALNLTKDSILANPVSKELGKFSGRKTIAERGGFPTDIFPAVSDGFWLALRPLLPGEHTINFGGKVGDPLNPFSVNVTYHITVVS